MNRYPIASIQARRLNWTNISQAPRLWFPGQEYEDTGSLGTASSWVDDIAAKNLTATTTQRPTIVNADVNYGGHNILDFNGSANYMITSPATVTGGINTLTVAWLGHTDSVSGVRKIVETTTGGAGSYAMFVEGAKLSCYARGAAGEDYVAGNTTIVTGTRYFFVIEIPFSNLSGAAPGTSNIRMWVNGVLQTNSIITETATNTTLNTSGRIVSRWISAGLQFWDGGMAVLGEWNGAWSASELANAYILAKTWGAA